MAVTTSVDLRNQVIYSIYIRNYSEEGTFAAVERDLDRIRNLGVDIIWFLPIYPIGEQKRKGTLGSPYAIKNYREVNPELGTLEDFIRLVEAIHSRGMKCMLDIVYNLPPRIPGLPKTILISFTAHRRERWETVWETGVMSLPLYRWLFG